MKKRELLIKKYGLVNFKIWIGVSNKAGVNELLIEEKYIKTPLNLTTYRILYKRTASLNIVNPKFWIMV